jgi:hypothetical protein
MRESQTLGSQHRSFEHPRAMKWDLRCNSNEQCQHAWTGHDKKMRNDSLSYVQQQVHKLQSITHIHKHFELLCYINEAVSLYHIVFRH